MRYFLIFLFLLYFSTGQVSAQENPPQNQARIWQKALQWIYEDNNKTVGKNAQKPVPTVSGERVAQFEKDLAAASKTRQDEYNFYTRLYQPVQEKLRKNQPVSDKVLIAAIVAEAAKKSDRKTEDLRFALETITPRNTETAQPEVPEEVPESILPPEENPATQGPENAPVPETSSNEIKTVKAESNMPLILSIAALLLAAFAFMRSSRKSSPSSVASGRTSESFATSTGVPVQGNQNLQALKKEIESLKKAYNHLKRENENWRAEMQDAIQELQKTAYDASANAEKYNHVSGNASQQIQPETQPVFEPEETSSQENFQVETDHLFTEEALPQILVKYTRVPEDGQLKERDLHHDSHDTWSFIQVTLPENGCNSAKFRINPHVNHALAINNSLDRLENAFEFARSSNKATQLINDADGELMRTAQGWQITKRAKIHLA
ncbi:hypothetical protein I5M27_16810 [Adhaeribacter sp. BT258]|uniref:Uncharacterized protein n=1 Tax=Adhaeribacter terrigena TaxID=2793070 RepID=A0ABS1C5L9_9BACT|nr:hypothetical protein [Adhaeribacter terrigena]MBK0404657.1 hypothetical protein [Adhaeribacter terrigena]